MAALWADGLWADGLWADGLWAVDGIAPTITTTGLPAPVQSVAYDFTLQATGTAPITWTVQTGVLPDGLTLETDGQLHGTPTTLESQNVVIRATNADGFADAGFTLTVTDGSSSDFRHPITSDLTRDLLTPLVIGLIE